MSSPPVEGERAAQGGSELESSSQELSRWAGQDEREDKITRRQARAGWRDKLALRLLYSSDPDTPSNPWGHTDGLDRSRLYYNMDRRTLVQSSEVIKQHDYYYYCYHCSPLHCSTH